MSVLFKKYKRIFRRNLQPVFALLVARKQGMDTSSWKALVNETLLHVVNNPVEYIGSDLPEKRLMTDILDEMREEFFKEISAFNAVPKH